MLFKLYDDKPLSVDDFFDIISINYEVKELSLAVALAERNIIELEKNLSAFFSHSKSPYLFCILYPLISTSYL